MMKNLKNSIYPIVFFVLMMTVTGCFKYEEVKMVRVVGVEVKDITAKGVNIHVDMQLDNPNNYNISIVGSDLDLFVKGKKSGKVTLKDKVILPKKSNGVHHFIFESEHKNMVADPLTILSSILGDSRIEVQVKGSIKAKAKGLSKSFPVDFKEKVSL